MNHKEATCEALRKLRQWASQGKLNDVRITHLQTVLERRLKNNHTRQSA